MTEILGFEGEYRWLSNFGEPGFFHEGVWYPTNEHFYQAWKTQSLDEFMLIRLASTPGQAKRHGRRATVRPDWELIKDTIMQIGIRAKFAFTTPDNINAAQQLLDTGDAYLEETNTWGDTYWGVCDGTGQNKLGQFLMLRRDELRREVGL